MTFSNFMRISYKYDSEQMVYFRSIGKTWLKPITATSAIGVDSMDLVGFTQHYSAQIPDQSIRIYIVRILLEFALKRSNRDSDLSGL